MQESEIKSIIDEMTLTEKVHMLAQKEGRYGKCERLGLSGINPQDNPRGGKDYFRSGKGQIDDGDYHPVAYPSAACMAMSWDEQMVYNIGKAMARACKANPEYVHCLNRPGANIKRSPLCGRNFEYYSEDPVLSGELAGAYIQGVQSENVSACLKHYVANNQEFERMTTNSIMSERALREVYMRVFEIAIKKGKPWMIMTSYNQLNGEWVNSNEYAMKILRDEFGYDGVVVSDFLAIHHNKVAAHENKLDIELAPDVVHSQELIEAVQTGKIDEKILNESVERILKLCCRLQKEEQIKTYDFVEEHRKAKCAAENSMVLLENHEILPLKKEQKGILVAGQLAKNPSYMGGGSGHMNGWKIDIPYDEIAERCSCPIAYVSAYELKEGYPPEDIQNEKMLSEAVEAAKKHEIVLFFGGLGYCCESEGWDRNDILLPESQRRVLDAMLKVNPNIILITVSGAALDLHEYKGKIAASLYAGYAGEAFGSAVASVIFGEAEPGGRLAETFPLCLEHTPAYLNFAGSLADEPDIMYGEDVFVGYRWYDARKLGTAYCFGHGLSYTTFEISDFRVDKKEITPQDTIKITATVRNTGTRPGSQVLQLYVRDQECITQRPLKELKAFSKVFLNPGERKTVEMTLDYKAFEFFSNSLKRWVIENGSFEVLLGVSAEEILCSETVTMSGGSQVYTYDEMTPLVWFIKNPRFFEILSEEFPAEKADIFDVTKSEFTILLYPLPFFKLKEPIMEQPIFTEEEINHIIRRMNERM